MAVPVSDRLTRLGYDRARWLLLGAGAVVLAVVAIVMFARRVDTVEVVATLLFLPVFVGFLVRGLAGGLVTGALAALAYVALRLPVVDAVGAASFTSLVASRSLSYLAFGAVGGWSASALESSLDKLERVDQIDDATGLRNARAFLQQTDLELARTQRYGSTFSVVVVEVAAADLASLGRRRRASLLRALGRELGAGLRTVDHLAHATDGSVNRFAATLPETGAEGAEVFRGRFAERFLSLLAAEGVERSAEQVRVVAATVPGDEDALAEVRSGFARADRLQHPEVPPGEGSTPGRGPGAVRAPGGGSR